MVVANDTLSVKGINYYFKKVNQYSHCVYCGRAYDGMGHVVAVLLRLPPAAVVV